MANDFYTYLATEIFSEQHTVSYRNIARVFKVHVNAAKCLLFEFYEKENKKKPGSVYATYLVSGVKKEEQAAVSRNGHTNGIEEDEPVPRSSPPPFTTPMLESSQHGCEDGHEETSKVSVKTITLVREDSLEAIKEQYDKITSVHLYSLSPHRIQDLVTLTDIGRELFTDVFVKEDPLANNKVYGVIQNPGVRRRTMLRPAPTQAQAPGPKFKPVKDEPKATSATISRLSTASQNDESSRPSSSGSTSATASTTRQPPVKRGASDLFKSFAKAKSKPTLERNDTDKSTNASASASGTEDIKMTDVGEDGEGESEDEALFLDTGTKKPARSKKRVSDIKKEREDKAAKLRKMMDSDGEGDGASSAGEKESKKAKQPKTENADGEEVAWSESDTDAKKSDWTGKKEKNGDDTVAGNTATPTSAAPKRRRGRRKVMKKRTMKDEEGYLVTREEAVWESFSEDDNDEGQNRTTTSASARGFSKPTAAAAMKPGALPKSQNQSQSQGKPSTGPGGGTGKSSSKGAKGGNIMSFFGKK